jgi:murein DD-endopeptidase MepM/ murein hydrolase activator NlpD
MHPRFRLASFTTAAVVAIISMGALSTNQIQNENEAILDWNEYSLEDFPQLPNGQSFTELTTVGDYPAIGEMTLGEVLPDKTTIGQVEGLDNVKLGDVVGSVDGLSGKKVGESPAILKIVENYATNKATEIGSRYAQKFADKYIGKLFNDVPALKELPIGDFKDILSGDPMSSIPGLADTAMNKIPGLDKVSLDKIPGLDKVPLSKILDLAKYSPVAIMDNVWSKEETKSLFKPISGSDEDGYSVPCNQASCSYIELEDYKGSLKGVLKPADLLSYHGARWIVGGPDKSKGQQMVKGGSGDVGAEFGGKEPTGRSLGEDAKIVLTKVDQSKGTANFSLYTRACTKFSGCTPKIIGPIPIGTFHETDLVFLGTPDYKLKKAKMPKWANDKIAGIIDKYEPALDAMDSLGGMGGNQAQQEDCAQKVLSKMSPGSLAKAGSFVPTMIKESLSAGYSANQTAFFIAMAEDKYNFNVDPSTLISQYKSAANTYITDKFVNYYSAASVSGVTGNTAQKAGLYQGALKPCQSANCSASGKMIRPSGGGVVSEFGMRLSPTLGVWKLHAGIDLGDGTGAPIRAADCGTVEYVGWEDGYGEVVVIKHGRYFTRSAHTSAQFVRQGQKVTQGQRIASAGATGRVTGPHLHWEVRDGGSFGKPLNPRQFINVN